MADPFDSVIFKGATAGAGGDGNGWVAADAQYRDLAHSDVVVTVIIKAIVGPAYTLISQPHG